MKIVPNIDSRAHDECYGAKMALSIGQSGVRFPQVLDAVQA
jgi:hypothetical protein